MIGGLDDQDERNLLSQAGGTKQGASPTTDWARTFSTRRAARGGELMDKRTNYDYD